jgi:hypothetical protein
VLKRIIAPLTLVLALVGVGVFIAPVAPASASFSQCPAGHACMFDGANFTGSMLDLPFSTSYPGCRNLSATWNDVPSSLIVQYGGGAFMRFWLNANCNNPGILNGKILGPNQSVADLSKETFVGGSWNNGISSYAVYLS